MRILIELEQDFQSFLSLSKIEGLLLACDIGKLVL